MEWRLPPEISVDSDLRQAVGGHPLVAQILARRGISDPEKARAFIDPDAYHPAPPTDIPDVDRAARRLLEAVEHGERILVWGDFDVDGQTATALLVDALRGLDGDVRYHIPHRISDGHGVQVPVLRHYLGGEDRVDLLLTCDTGIAAHDAVDAAQAAGVDVIITDHHSLTPQLPAAYAVVSTQRLPEGHVLRTLPGVGVAYKLMQHLYDLTGRGSEVERLLDLVALGIVADVVEQRDDARYLLQRGMDRLRASARTGLKALMEAAQVDPVNLSADTIGYQVGPRLNALGRLDDANLAVELLTTRDVNRAQQIANRLETLNDKRKLIENQIYSAAQDQIAADPSLLNFDALVVAGPDWHPGVIGIVASRLVEQHSRPVVVLSLQNGSPARGSARSVPGVDIGRAIALQADILLAHGGHPGAAGLMLNEDRIPEFRRRLSNAVREMREPVAEDGLPIDAVVSLDKLSIGLAEDLNRLAPFGAGNPPIRLLAQGLRLTEHTVFGAAHNHRRLTVTDAAGIPYSVTWWRGDEHPLPPEHLDMVFIPRINDYKGRRSLQLEWVDGRSVPGMERPAGPRCELIDLRRADDPLAALPREDLLVFWVEPSGSAPDTDGVRGQVAARSSLPLCDKLVIWTAPPGREELRQALDRTGARTVYLVARHPVGDTSEGFIKRLGGLVNYAMSHYEGEASVARLAEETAQREVTVRRGLEYIAVRGKIRVEFKDSDRVVISRLDPAHAPAPSDVELEGLEATLRALLSEARAFRTYFQTVDDVSELFKP
ncbi:MAG: hypothetical protein Kow00124_15310 [Anaerolineae bacterium]